MYIPTLFVASRFSMCTLVLIFAIVCNINSFRPQSPIFCAGIDQDATPLPAPRPRDGIDSILSGNLPQPQSLTRARLPSRNDTTRVNRWLSKIIPPHRLILVHEDTQVNPSCAASCPESLIGDGYCDVQCDTVDCRYDENDCTSRCAPFCSESWVGDGYCDLQCDVEACSHDGGDCRGINDPSTALSCSESWLGDGYCDPTCPKEDNDDCDDTCATGCPLSWVGDSICDPLCNTDVCHNDKGDCEATRSPDLGYELSDAFVNIFGRLVHDPELQRTTLENSYSSVLADIGIHLDVNRIANLNHEEVAAALHTIRNANEKVEQDVTVSRLVAELMEAMMEEFPEPSGPTSGTAHTPTFGELEDLQEWVDFFDLPDDDLEFLLTGTNMGDWLGMSDHNDTESDMESNLLSLPASEETHNLREMKSTHEDAAAVGVTQKGDRPIVEVYTNDFMDFFSDLSWDSDTVSGTKTSLPYDHWGEEFVE